MTTLRRRLFVPTAVLAAFAAGTLAYLAWDSTFEARALKRSTDEVRAASTLAFALTEASHDEELIVLEMRGAAPGALDGALAEATAREVEIVARISSRPLAPEAAAIWRDYLRARASRLDARREIVESSLGGDAARIALAYDKWHLLGERTRALLKNFTVLHLRLLDAAVIELQQRRERSLWAGAVATVLGVLLAAAVSIVLARSIVLPLVRMASAAEEISAGKTSRVPGEERSDELGVLARSLNGMTERLVAANARLSEAVRARDEFLSIASHELKTPLTPMKLRLDQLLRAASRSGDGEVSREALLRASETLQRQLTRLSKLVGSLLDISRITSGKLALDLEELSVSQLVHEVLERLSEEIEGAGCALETDTGGELRLTGDRLRLDQVVSNLVANAVKYAPGARLAVRVRSRERVVEIEVEDDGPGIDPSDHERIFTRFERAVGRGESVAGLGLGLYIAREIVQAHGGELSLQSAVGRGARFTVRLPREPAAVAQEDREGPGAALNGRRLPARTDAR